MYKTINEELEKIMEERGVQILYACEAGSRCWGIESEDSDYDVRFIYAHNWRWYMALNEGRDVIEKPYGNLDIAGWDLRKALRLFKKSNPPLLEWMNSGLVYYNHNYWINLLRDLISQYYNPTAAAYHYYHMAKGNFRDYLQGDEIWRKKYLYVLRPLLCVRYIEKTGDLPPNDFWALVLVNKFDFEFEQELRRLLEAKQSGEEMGFGPRIPAISDFVENELNRLEEQRFSGKPALKSWNLLNDLFIKTVFKEPLLQQMESIL